MSQIPVYMPVFKYIGMLHAHLTVKKALHQLQCLTSRLAMHSSLDHFGQSVVSRLESNLLHQQPGMQPPSCTPDT